MSGAKPWTAKPPAHDRLHRAVTGALPRATCSVGWERPAGFRSDIAGLRRRPHRREQCEPGWRLAALGNIKRSLCQPGVDIDANSSSCFLCPHRPYRRRPRVAPGGARPVRSTPRCRRASPIATSGRSAPAPGSPTSPSPTAPLKSHLYTMYVGLRYGGRLEDDQQRHDVRPRVRRPEHRIDRRRRRRALEREHRLGRARAMRRTCACRCRRRRLQVDRRRQDLAEDGPRRHPPHRAHRRSIRPGPTWSTSRPWDGSGRPTRNAASSRRATAAGRGRRCSTSTTRRARSTS